MEEWKPIMYPDLLGRYEVSNQGRIKRLARSICYKDGRTEFLKEKLMSPHLSPKGYVLIRLTGISTANTYKVHRIVADHFISNPKNLPEVNHKDENKANNSVENLEWCTHQYNAVYGSRLQRLGAMTSSRQKGRKLSLETRAKISASRKGFKHSEEWKLEHSRKMKERYRVLNNQ